MTQHTKHSIIDKADNMAFSGFFKVLGNTCNIYNIGLIEKQAGAELGQAQLKLALGTADVTQLCNISLALQIVKLQSRATVQSSVLGLGVDIVSPCHNNKNTPTKIYQKGVYSKSKI